MFESRRISARVGMAVVVVGLGVGVAASPAGGAAPTCGASTATDAVRDAALARIGVFVGVEESEQAAAARR